MKELILNANLHQSINANNHLIGLVLCGGKSSRMQTDKAFIKYHNIPQAYYLYNQIKTYCKHVYLSCNQTQIALINEEYQYICDNATTKDSGPISALISALERHKNKSFLVLACDYPLLTNDDILKLKTAWEDSTNSVSFYNNETNFREPLLAIYYQKDLEKLLQFYNDGKTSLQHFLKEINAKKINAISNISLKSIDTKEEFEEIFKLINNNT